MNNRQGDKEAGRQGEKHSARSRTSSASCPKHLPSDLPADVNTSISLSPCLPVSSSASPRKITLQQWADRYRELKSAGLQEPPYGGPLQRHVTEGGDFRLTRLAFDNSPAALRLWNFLLTEEDRLHDAARAGKKIVGAMKDLGTVPVLAYSLPDTIAFYPDGAWWIPCVMEMTSRDLHVADSLGIDESFCPVRAMLGAFVTGEHFPMPHLLTCSVGATCDDFSAIAQRLEALGHPILWWEIPARRAPQDGEEAVTLPGCHASANPAVADLRRHVPGATAASFAAVPPTNMLPQTAPQCLPFTAPRSQVDIVQSELKRIKAALESLAGVKLTDDMLSRGIAIANRIRAVLRELRLLAYCAPVCPMPALEMLIAEMLAIHFCSDQLECLAVLEELLAETKRRVAAGTGVLDSQAVRIFWVNPVADLAAMNLLEDCGGRICGTEYLFCHALDEIPTDLPPMEALARIALADPMAGPAADRAARICADAAALGAEAVVISRIPGASHCATEGQIITRMVECDLGLPTVQIEVPPLSQSLAPVLRTRLGALIETARGRRR